MLTKFLKIESNSVIAGLICVVNYHLGLKCFRYGPVFVITLFVKTEFQYMFGCRALADLPQINKPGQAQTKLSQMFLCKPKALSMPVTICAPVTPTAKCSFSNTFVIDARQAQLPPSDASGNDNTLSPLRLELSSSTKFTLGFSDQRIIS